MVDLLRCDLKRAIKDKLFLVLCIVGGAFAVITPLLYKALFASLNVEVGMLGLQMNARSLFFSSFSLTNNFGLILPILIAIILCKDFSHGTVRNKIISGKSRGSIYLSLLITCATLMCLFILAHAVLTLLVSLIFFDYQAVPFSAQDFGYLMASLGLEMLVYLLICAILTFFIMFMKNAGLAIVMYFVVNFGMTIIGSVMQAAMLFSNATDTVAYKLLEFLTNANVFTTTAINGTALSTPELLALIIPNVIFTALFILLGLFAFKKKELK